MRGAFLHGDFGQGVYAKLSPGIDGEEDDVLLIKKSLSCLKPVSKIRYDSLKQRLVSSRMREPLKETNYT